MFFIGIFGVKEVLKPIGTYNNVICPACNVLTRFEIFRIYSYFHIFFIPTFRWNMRYYSKSACCDSIYVLDTIIGQQYVNGRTPEIKNEYLRPVNQCLPDRTCSNCGAKVELEHSFCPYCGRRL
ncbi:MAG: zinc ribbon domain-containing protein [Desulfosporosinus sp.]